MAGVFERWGGDVPEVNSAINVVPLVDVTLVLLIIFMVITPMLQVGAAVQLPTTDNPEEIKREEKQLLIPLRNDLSVYIGDDVYCDNLYKGDPGKLDGKLKEIQSRDPNREVLLKGDRRVTFGDIRNLMKHVQAAGFTKVGLLVDRKHRG